MRAFEFITENSRWEEWKKDKIQVDINGNEYFVSAKDNHLILHGVGVPSFAWSNRDGDGHEAEFDFDFDLHSNQILDVEYPNLEDEGYYLYDGGNSFADDIHDIVGEFKEIYSEEDRRRMLNKLTPEEGGIEVDNDWFEGSIPFAGKKVGHKEGPAGQWRNKGSSANRSAKPGDLVGGGAA